MQVLLGDRALSISFVSPDQLNVQVPFDLPVDTQIQLIVRRNNALSVPESLLVAAAQPVTIEVAGQTSLPVTMAIR